MKKTILTAALILATSTSYALKETKIATCQLLDDDKSKIGVMSILSSDNGDEGFLKFSYTLKETPNEKIQFIDNVQDDGAAFLTAEKSALYVSYEEISATGTNAHAPSVAAVYLKNRSGVITGKLKADFLKANLVCEQTRK